MKKRGEWDGYGRPRKLNRIDYLKLYHKHRDKPNWEQTICEEAHISRSTLKPYLQEYMY